MGLFISIGLSLFSIFTDAIGTKKEIRAEESGTNKRVQQMQERFKAASDPHAWYQQQIAETLRKERE